MGTRSSALINTAPINTAPIKTPRTSQRFERKAQAGFLLRSGRFSLWGGRGRSLTTLIGISPLLAAGCALFQEDPKPCFEGYDIGSRLEVTLGEPVEPDGTEPTLDECFEEYGIVPGETLTLEVTRLQGHCQAASGPLTGLSKLSVTPKAEQPLQDANALIDAEYHYSLSKQCSGELSLVVLTEDLPTPPSSSAATGQPPGKAVVSLQNDNAPGCPLSCIGSFRADSRVVE